MSVDSPVPDEHIPSEDVEMDVLNEASNSTLVTMGTAGCGVQQKDSLKDCTQVIQPNIRRRSAFLRDRFEKLKELETRCFCHQKLKQPADKKARNRLIAACVIVFVFMIGEILGKELCRAMDGHVI